MSHDPTHVSYEAQVIALEQEIEALRAIRGPGHAVPAPMKRQAKITAMIDARIAALMAIQDDMIARAGL